MPLYEYHCPSCGNNFEELQRGFEDKEISCPACGQPCRHMVSNTSFRLKGTGWYVTDYAKNPAKNQKCGS